MGCNCGRRRAVLQVPPPGTPVPESTTEALVAGAEVREMPAPVNATDPATGVAPSATSSDS